MKLVVISDSHGNIANLKHVMGFAKKINAKAVIHCGDWNTLESVEAVLSFGIPLYSVLGNADIDLKVEEILSNRCKKFDRVSLRFRLGGKNMGTIHNSRDFDVSEQNLDILFYGHDHKQSEYDRDKLKFINPGALENGVNFAVYDITSGKIEFIHE